MKIGILTFDHALNYGAVLQAYALQQALKKLNIQNEIIDYRCPAFEKQYESFWGQGTAVGKLKHALLYFQNRRIRARFAEFHNRFLFSSGECYHHAEELSAANGRYDFFLTGSDQVWNASLTEFDKTYFLSFVADNRKKISYAASFGVSDFPKAWQEQSRVLLDSFYGLSVREQEGADIVRDLIGREAQVHLDPVLLLTTDDWMRFVKPVSGRNYIFVYLLAKTDTVFRFIETISEKTGCDVLWFGPGVRRPVRAKYIRTGGPEDFLGYLANASYVVTNSFHGTAFSILFHKKFFVELLPEPSKANSRLENILSIFHLKDRLILNGKNQNIKEQIDPDGIEQILEGEREKTFNYFKKVLGLNV